MIMSSTFGFVDILRIIGILAFAALSGWVIYKLMKSADADEDSKDQESEENNKKE